MKTCPKCQTEKPITEYHKNSASPDRLRSQCKDCTKAYQANLYKKNSEWRSRKADYNRKYNSRPGIAEAKRGTDLKKKYGITLDDYNQMLEEQNGVCYICKSPPGMRSLHVDHNHSTGEVRALLCTSCNRGLGNFQDNPEILANAISYLKEKGDYSS